MNENDLSHLSYKELQALAHTYRVPGNIKKNLLVRTLEAIQSGNEMEVDRMLTEVQQTRKKRVKKQKLNIMNVSSTPLHSPNYTINEDCYYVRHQPPYQWVGAEEEIAIREEEAMRVPNYKEFQQFLLHRIQRDPYQIYTNLSENEVGQGSSIVDLRMGAGTSVLRPMMMEGESVKLTTEMESHNWNCPSSEVELQMLDDAVGKEQGRPILLKKMLEAPVGANLGEIASPDTISHRIWPIDQYQSNGNALDNSDTLTADSEIEYEDIWENTNNNNNNTGNYYCPINDGKNNVYGNETEMSNRNTESIGQFRNNYENEVMEQYPLSGGYNDTHSNCEKWIAANNFVNRDGSCIEQVSDNSRACNTLYYGNNSHNSTITRGINYDRKYSCNGTNVDNVNYDDKEMTLQVQRIDNWNNDNHSYYQNNNNNNNSNQAMNSTINPEIYYSQQINRQPMADVNRHYFPQESNETRDIHNTCQTIVESIAHPVQLTGNIYKYPDSSFHNNHENNNVMQYNSGYYSQYSHENTENLADFSTSLNPDQQHQQQEQETNNIFQDINVRKVHSSGMQTITNVLDPFWPRWPINSTQTSNGQLETILNLHSRENNWNLDYSKRNETSSVYCYTEPIVTQRIEGTHNWCDKNKPLIAETRKHLFTPKVLIYNDASTGLIMANINDTSNNDENQSQEQLQEQSKDETFNSSGDHDYELRVSDNSSDSSINDVWIHDYANYPVSSDNALQSVDLTNDENEDDLFLVDVRDTSQNSIDDHTIETFTDMSY